MKNESFYLSMEVQKYKRSIKVPTKVTKTISKTKIIKYINANK